MLGARLQLLDERPFVLLHALLNTFLIVLAPLHAIVGKLGANPVFLAFLNYVPAVLLNAAFSRGSELRGTRHQDRCDNQ